MIWCNITPTSLFSLYISFVFLTHLCKTTRHSKYALETWVGTWGFLSFYTRLWKNNYNPCLALEQNQQLEWVNQQYKWVMLSSFAKLQFDIFTLICFCHWTNRKLVTHRLRHAFLNDVKTFSDHYLRVVSGLQPQSLVSGKRAQFKCKVEGHPIESLVFTWWVWVKIRNIGYILTYSRASVFMRINFRFPSFIQAGFAWTKTINIPKLLFFEPISAVFHLCSSTVLYSCPKLNLSRYRDSWWLSLRVSVHFRKYPTSSWH